MRKLKFLVFVSTWLASFACLAIEPVDKEHFVFYFDNPSYIEQADSAMNQVRKQMIGLVQDSLDYKASVYLLENIDEFNKVIRG